MEIRLRNRNKQTIGPVAIRLQSLVIAFLFVGIASNGHGEDSAPSSNAAVRFTNITAEIARDHWEAVQLLHNEGYASVQELQNSEQNYQISLAGVEEVISQSNRQNGNSPAPEFYAIQLSTPAHDAPSTGNATTTHHRQILVHLPGLSRSKATRYFSTLLLSDLDVSEPAITSEDFTISADPRKNLIEKRLAFQEELIRRLEIINEDANTNTKELDLAKLRRDQLVAERDMITPFVVITRHDSDVMSPPPAAFQNPLADHEFQRLIQNATQTANSAVDQASAVVQHNKRSLTHHSQRLRLLLEIRDGSLASHRETEREQLLLDTATASLAHARESLQCRQAELRYLQELEGSTLDPSQNPRLQDALLDLLRNHANCTSAIAEWVAKAKYLEWKLSAINSLFEDGHASWWEKSQAELAVAEADSAQRQADIQLSIAGRTLRICEKVLSQ